MYDLQGAVSGAMRLPSYITYDREFLSWFTEFQHNTFWLWRKYREPGGMSHPGAKPFAQVDLFSRVFAGLLSPKILDYLGSVSQRDLLHLRDVGNGILLITADLEEGEFTHVNDGVPLVNGQRVQIRQDLLDDLAYFHHEAWLATRNEMQELSEQLKMKAICPPKRKEHVPFVRFKPDKSWDRDKGNIYGLAFGLAVMADERFQVLFGASEK